MKINYVKDNPREIQLEDDLPPYMTEGVANDIAEIFNTPLSGAYNWDYTCLLYTSPSPRDQRGSRMPSSA